jgi:hypothetical protein
MVFWPARCEVESEPVVGAILQKKTSLLYDLHRLNERFDGKLQISDFKDGTNRVRVELPCRSPAAAHKNAARLSSELREQMAIGSLLSRLPTTKDVLRALKKS